MVTSCILMLSARVMSAKHKQANTVLECIQEMMSQSLLTIKIFDWGSPVVWDLHVLARGSHGSLLVPGLMWLECVSGSWMMKTLMLLPAPSTSGTSSPDVVGAGTCRYMEAVHTPEPGCESFTEVGSACDLIFPPQFWGFPNIISKQLHVTSKDFQLEYFIRSDTCNSNVGSPFSSELDNVCRLLRLSPRW